jgi:hypothetical protein
MFSDPRWYWWSRPTSNPVPLDDKLLIGWHKKIMSDNVAYCDGSVRITRVETLDEFPSEILERMNVCTDYDANMFLRRGRNWQTDTYPAKAALTVSYEWRSSDHRPFLSSRDELSAHRGWPFDSFSENANPFTH